jgi:hypothetical protein
MPSPINYGTVVGPLGTDFAGGVKAYNTVADTIDANFDKVNEWAAKADDAFAVAVVPRKPTIFTAASGWLIESVDDTYQTYGRKWGAVTFVNLRIKRTGAAIASTSGGNITNNTVGTLAVGWRPLTTVYLAASMENAAPVQVYIDSNGVVVMTALNQGGRSFAQNWRLILNACWLNADTQPCGRSGRPRLTPRDQARREINARVGRELASRKRTSPDRVAIVDPAEGSSSPRNRIARRGVPSRIGLEGRRWRNRF